MKIEWKTCLRVGVSIFLLYLCINYWSVVAGFLSAAVGAASPLIVGGVIAYLVNILMRLYERHYFPKAKKKWLIKSRRPVCMTFAFVTLVAVVALVVWLVVPQLISCVQLIISEVPDAIKSIVKWLDSMNVLPKNIEETLTAIDWKSQIGQIANFLASGVGSVTDIVVGTVSSVFSGIVTSLIGVIFAIYILSGKDTLGRQFDRVMKHFLPEKHYSKLTHTLGVADDCFRRYIVGQCTEAVILGVLCALGMMILKLPYAAMIGALVAFTALIPVAGAYIGAAVGALMIFTVSPVKVIVFLVFLVILQQLEGNLVYPRVVGSSMGLPGIWVLAAVTVGGGVMGVMGMLLGVPLAAVAYRLLREKLNEADAMSPQTTAEPIVEAVDKSDEAEQTES